MGDSLMGLKLKEMLKNLCCCNGWCYGVFWRFDQKNSMLLTVEDAYYEEQMGEVANKMLQQIRMLGEGVVGQAAFTGKDQWILSDGNNDSLGSQDLLQDDSDIQHQFCSGVKTIAVISVESQGVVQFGSFEKILKRQEFLDQTKSLFREMEYTDRLTSFVDPPSSLNYENYDLDEWFAAFCNGYITPMHGGSCNELMDLTQSSVLTSDTQQERMSPFCWGSIDRTDQLQTVGDISSTDANKLEMSSHLDTSISKSAAKTPCFSTCSNEGSILTSLESQLQVDNPFEWFAPSPEYSISGMANAVNDYLSQPHGLTSVSSGLVGDILPNILFKEHEYSMQSSITDTYFCGGQQKSLAVESVKNDLFDGLGSESELHQTGQVRDLWEHMMLPMSNGGNNLPTSTAVSECISKSDVSSTAVPQKGLFSKLGLEEILDSVNNCSYVSKSSIDDQLCATKRRRVETASVNSNQDQLTSVSCSGGSPMMHSAYNLSKTNDILCGKQLFPKSQVGLWIDDSYGINNAVLTKPKKPEEPTKPTKKRAKPGESNRPRPKDRQQTQDRFKELKEIIPDGAKCSIDALLDRTIKYMLFLQSVIKYVDKLKQVENPKVIGQENIMAPENSISSGGGVTWALEVGDQTMVCPVRVEDLNQPGLMLIEMLCEDRGFFLEIADVIRGFELNILKGVMEKQEDKIWARFIVEANVQVKRIDLLCSLIELQQQMATAGMDSMKNIMNGTIPLLSSYQQPSLPCSSTNNNHQEHSLQYPVSKAKPLQ